ncbi:ATP-dependent dethiobiotin synthetase BioD [Caulobacter sp. Root1455]|uniref:dethiobiotin synthase n=1 Tax=Caulobacter sp. Root1455 TaxID=1736465 RepID=UPI0006F8DED1|nr:dethiobiotin synthase [Caulobacter sp. Root1455]KQZ05851.1 ATP-dependent dethiobiotin synthetase BioD [Caulobacter sp. Root1455]
MPALFVTGTGTDIGKTYVSCALIRALKARGAVVDAFKPVVSGFDPRDAAGSDPARLAAALGAPGDVFRIAPRRYRAPLSPNIAARLEGQALVLDDMVIDAVARAAELRDGLLLVEGAGGVMSPLTDGETNLDMITALGAPVLLVAGSYLGTISHVLTALVALRSARAEVAAVVMSESLDAPDLAQTAQALAPFLEDVPLFLAPRADAWNAAALADHLLNVLGTS